MHRHGRPTRAISLFLVGLSIFSLNCRSGRMRLDPIAHEDLDQTFQSTGLVVGVRGVPRIESNVYQDALEREITRALAESGLFREATRRDFDEGDVDLVLHVGKSDLSYRRQPNLAYFPLAILTVTIYIWVGGPIFTDKQFFEIPIRVEGRRLPTPVEFVTKLDTSHWVNLYHPEYRARALDRPCPAPNSADVLNDLLRKLSSALRQSGVAVGEADTDQGIASLRRSEDRR